jgi:hypothetical protein
MVGLTEKVEALERRLDRLLKVFDRLRKDLPTENPKRRHPLCTKTCVEEIIQHFNEFSAELKSVKEALNTCSFTDSGNSPCDALATNIEVTLQAELQHKAPSLRQDTEQVPPAIPENGQRESVAANAPEPVRRPSPASPPGQNIMTKEPLTQAHQVPLGYEVSPTPSTSTEPLNRMIPLNGVLLDPQSEEESIPIFHYNYEDISGNLNKVKLM